MKNPAVTKSPALDTLDRLRALRAIAVVRARNPEEAIAIADALFAAGLEAIELTFTTPEIERAFPEVRRRLGSRLLLGAGTITTLDQLRSAVEAGADFLVSPHLNPALLKAMLATGRLALPGVLTPSEVASALLLGADAVKLFPASTVGPEHMKALFGPVPGVAGRPHRRNYHRFGRHVAGRGSRRCRSRRRAPPEGAARRGRVGRDQRQRLETSRRPS